MDAILTGALLCFLLLQFFPSWINESLFIDFVVRFRWLGSWFHYEQRASMFTTAVTLTLVTLLVLFFDSTGELVLRFFQWNWLENLVRCLMSCSVRCFKHFAYLVWLKFKERCCYFIYESMAGFCQPRALRLHALRGLFAHVKLPMFCRNCRLYCA